MNLTFVICTLLLVLAQPQSCANLISFCTNYVCNGDFEQPRITSILKWQYFAEIPCWKGTHQLELNKITQFGDSQYMDLDADKTGQGYGQTIKLDHAGGYFLEFEYSTRTFVSLMENSFKVYFNGELVADVRPGEYERKKVKLTVEGIIGDNTLEFVDNGVEPLHGNGIDNVGLYRMRNLVQ